MGQETLESISNLRQTTDCRGLTSEQVKEALFKYGNNVLPEKKNDSILKVFFRQFLTPFVYILFAAAVISVLLSQQINAVFIVLVLILNAAIGATQEFSAQRSASALKKMVPINARVLRDGEKKEVPASDLVPGDWVFLASGDRVPADIVLSESAQLMADESILTGESVGVNKRVDLSDADRAKENSVIEQQKVYAGTMITHGRGQGVVSATGVGTQIGKIAQQVTQSAQAHPPLMQRIDRFTKNISFAVIIVITVLLTITVVRGDSLASVFLLGVALCVSAIPEGLPAAITVALAIGMRRMAKVNVIIRKLVAVESLGSCTCIASDKTGTLTMNQMTIERIVLPNHKSYVVPSKNHLDGSGVANTFMNDVSDTESGGLAALVKAGILANEANIPLGDEMPPSGDGVDIAFLLLGRKAGLEQQNLIEKYPSKYLIAYESEQAFSARFCDDCRSEQLILALKGACETVLPMCESSLDGSPIDANQIQEQTQVLASEGYRVLALASGTFPKDQDASELPLTGLSFLGLVGIIDPMRPEAVEAVKQCQSAKIRVMMITGDHPGTAQAIARQLGIINQSNEMVVTGAQLSQASQQEQAQLVQKCNVFARVSPIDKSLITQILIDQGAYVAVTGDGVNDAPALKKAHVGVAMGLRGTDVARESADIMLTDDNFSSVVQGIEQGRVVYNNIRKVVFLLISTGAAEIFLFLLSVLFGLPMPLFPVQLLWLNLVTNGIQDVALAFEPAEGDELSKPPRPPNESIFNRLMVERILVNAIVMGGLAFIVFVVCLEVMRFSEFDSRNITLLLMVLFENVHVLNSRSESMSVFKQPFFSNRLLLFGMLAAQSIHVIAMHLPITQKVLQIEPVSLSLWFGLLLVALLLIVIDESHKFILKKKGAHVESALNTKASVHHD